VVNQPGEWIDPSLTRAELCIPACRRLRRRAGGVLFSHLHSRHATTAEASLHVLFSSWPRPSVSQPQLISFRTRRGVRASSRYPVWTKAYHCPVSPETTLASAVFRVTPSVQMKFAVAKDVVSQGSRDRLSELLSTGLDLFERLEW